jgi:adenylate cyclase
VANDSIGLAVKVRRAKGVQMACFLALLVVGLRFVPFTSRLTLFPLIENYAYDSYLDHRPVQDMSRYLIITIDEESLLPEKLGRFPWDRSRYAELLTHLGSARVVAFDILFPEPAPHDAQLAAAIQRHGRVVLAAHNRPKMGNGSSNPWQGYGQHVSGEMPVVSPTMEFVPPVPVLAQAAAGIGYADIEPDSDGVYRRAKPARATPAGLVYPHFATEIARVASDTEPAAVAAGVAAGRVAMQGNTNGPAPLRNGRMLISYAGPSGTVPTVSFWKVLQGQYDRELFRDKIILVGATAAGLYDVRPAPFRTGSRIFYGVETNANIAHSLLDVRPLADASGFWPWGLYALLVGMLVGFAIWHSREVLAAVVGIGGLALLALPMFWVGVTWLHQVVPYSGIVLAVGVPMALALYERLGVEKRAVQGQFATYVSPDVLQELTSHPELVRLGQRRMVTLMFTDVRGSTTLAEQIEPDVWIAQLNEYLSEMSDAIFVYDGYLDKFMGDGIMALWNAFGNQEDHAQLATRAAVQMLERLRLLNAEWEQRSDRVPFQIGIGLHTGEAIIGNVGSERRAQYTAIGDAVNTASRIEALTKEFKAQLILSETTAKLVQDSIKLVELGEAELKGREQPVMIYKPEGYPGEVKGRVQQKEK